MTDTKGKDDLQRVEMDVDDSKISDCPETHWTMYLCCPLRFWFVWILPYIMYFFWKPAKLRNLPKLHVTNRVETLERKFKYWWSVYSFKEIDMHSFRAMSWSSKIWIYMLTCCRLVNTICCRCCFPIIPGMKILMVMMSVFGVEYWTAFFVMVLSITGQVFVPKVMQFFLEGLAPKSTDEVEQYLEFCKSILPEDLQPEDSSEYFRTNEYEIWIWMASLVFIQFFSYTMMEWSYHVSVKIGMNCRAVLQSLIFTKTLRLSSKSRLTFDNGTILNYSSIDLFKIEQVFMFIHYGVASYVQLFGSLYFLIDLIDWGTLTGSAALLVFIPFVCCVMIAYLGLLTKLKGIQDKRIASVNEVLQGVRIIKFFTWEDPYSKKISKIRKVEIYILRFLFSMFAMLFSLFSSLGTIVSVFAFMMYFYIHGHLSPIVVFTALTYFNLLKFPLMVAPMTITMVGDMYVSVCRLEKFFNCEEIGKRSVDDIRPIGVAAKEGEEENFFDLEHPNAVEIENGNFVWDADPKDLMKKLEKRTEEEKKKMDERHEKLKNLWETSKTKYTKKRVKLQKKKMKIEKKEMKKKWKLLRKRFKKEIKKKKKERKKGITTFLVGESDTEEEEEEILSDDDDDDDADEELDGESVEDGVGDTDSDEENEGGEEEEEDISEDESEDEEDLDTKPKKSTKKEIAEWVEKQMKKETKTLQGRLKNINLVLPRGKLTMICGGVGSGKSSLLNAILGEMKSDDETKVWVRGRLAYTCQTSWIQNATLKDNILFGSEYDFEKFKRVCQACSLEKDLKTLQGGVDIEIGEKGINLSGGQKYRVSLARACYQDDADILLFDDPLAAVDSHVGSHIMDECLLNLLADKTRIVVTHQIQYLEKADYVICMKKGMICEMGEYQELMDLPDGEVKRMVQQFFASKDDDLEKKVEEEEGEEEEHYEEEEIMKKEEEEIYDEEDEGEEGSDEDAIYGEGEGVDENRKKNVLIQKEEKRRGVVSPSVFLLYIKSMGCCYGIIPVLIIISTQIIAQLFVSGADWYLSEWSKGTFTEEFDNYYTTHIRFFDIPTYNETLNETAPVLTPDYSLDMLSEDDMLSLYFYILVYPEYEYYDEEDYPTTSSTGDGCPFWDEGGTCFEIRNVDIFWKDDYEGDTKTKSGLTQYQSVIIYGVIALIGLFFAFVRDCVFLNFGLTSSSNVHKKALASLLHAPMSFFDTTPLGRIMNRFSNDLQSMDGKLLFSLTFVLSMGSGILFTFILIAYLTRGIGLAFVIPICIAYLIFYVFYRQTNLELKRIVTITKSPILSLIGESLEGLSTIRAYDAGGRFKERLRRYINLNNRAHFLMVSSERWMGVTMTTMGCFLILMICSLSIVSWYYWDWEIDIAHLGLAISYSIFVCNLMYGLSEQITISEIEFSSVERLKHYVEGIPKEKPRVIKGVDDELKKKKKWPSTGKIKFTNFSMRYRLGLPLVLKNLYFEIGDGEKIGVCGRTGSGKSSIMLCLFRLIEAAEGKIEIDGQDISKIGTKLLRQSVSIIPQDPVLFSGTVRSNIDPFHNYSDRQCWEALEKSRLKEVIRDRPKQLGGTVKEGGANFSVGERQLLCLARAMLKETKILIMDECTASIDLELDEFIQKTIRKEFQNCTVLTIAHRINTIIDYDRIMVLEKGEIAEFDTPRNLLMGYQSSDEDYSSTDSSDDDDDETGVRKMRRRIERNQGIFRKLVKETGKKNEAFLIDVALGIKEVNFDGAKKQKKQKKKKGKAKKQKKKKRKKKKKKYEEDEEATMVQDLEDDEKDDSDEPDLSSSSSDFE